MQCFDNVYDLTAKLSFKVWIMVGIYIGIAVLGVIILMVFVDQLPGYIKQRESRGQLKNEIKTLLFATFKHLRHSKQLLLIPLTI